MVKAWDVDVDGAASSTSEDGDVLVVSAPPPPPFPDFVDALSGVTCCCAAWSVFERPWRAARGGVAMGDLFVRRLVEVVVARVAFFSCELMAILEELGAFFIEVSAVGLKKMWCEEVGEQ